MTFWFLALLAAATRALGDFRDPIYAMAAAIALGFVWRDFPSIRIWGRTINWLLRWSSWALAVGVFAWLNMPFKIIVATAIVWAFDRFGAPEKRGRFGALVVTGALYSFWWTIFFQLPPFYRLISEWSFSYTHLITGAMQKPLILGPSASAADLLILGLCAIVAVTLTARQRRWAWAIVWAVLLEAGRIIYIWTAPAILTLIGKVIPISSTPHLDLPWVYLIFVACVMWLCQRAVESGQAVAGGKVEVRWKYATAVIVVLGFIIAGVGSYTSRPIRVLFLDRKTLDMGLPHHGSYGDRSGGMFGYLPPFLAASGYTVIERDLSPGLLDSVDVIFMANVLKKFSPTERDQIWKFVADGGGLLIVGDHTGTDAIRDPTNDLLAPCGMEINFDTADPLRHSWVSEKSFLFHPAGRSGGVMDGELWLGASITPGPNGEPFIVGRGAFSDPGDLNNKNRSYLGNLAYDPGEPLGDVVLAAAAHWGKGKAVLHGDTSPYQNGTIVRSYSMINRTIRWLANRGISSILDRWRNWLLAILLGVGGTLLVFAANRQPNLILAGLLIPAVSVALWSAIPGPRGSTWIPKDFRLALIDTGHKELFDGMAWEPASTGGLEFNLMRNGYAPRFADTPAQLDCDSASLYILSAPSVAPSGETINRFERYVNNGGWLLVNAGWNLEPKVHDLLDRFGVTMQNIPLGQTMGVAFGDSVRMADAYPLAGDGPGIENLITAYDYPVAKLVHRGRGGVVVIGDSQFLYNKNLEGQNELLVMENVTFFRKLMDQIKGPAKP